MICPLLLVPVHDGSDVPLLTLQQEHAPPPRTIATQALDLEFFSPTPMLNTATQVSSLMSHALRLLS